MARKFSSGFETGSVLGYEWNANSGSPAISSTTKRSGSYALQISSLASTTSKFVRERYMLSEAANERYFRVYAYFVTFPSAENRIMVWNDSTTVTSTPSLYLTVDNSGVLKLYDEDGQITGTTTLSATTWYRIEVHYSNTPAGGSHVVEGRVNGTNFASSSTRDIAATNSPFYFYLGGNLNGEAQTTGEWYFDDLAINDATGSFQNSWPGEGEIVYLRPSAAGDASDWSNDYTAVDEVPPDDSTSMVLSNTLNATDDYNIDNTPAALESTDIINCVQVIGRISGAAASNNSGVVFRIKSDTGATVEESPEIIPASTSWITNDATLKESKLTLYDLPGASTTRWSKATLDTAQLGIRVSTADTNEARLTSMWLLVDHKPVPTQSVSGQLTSSGTLLAKTLKVLSGALTSIGGLVTSFIPGGGGTQYPQAVSGTVTTSGTITKQDNKPVSGALGTSGVLLNSTRKILSGVLNSSGSLIKRTGKVVSGVVTSSGDLVKLTLLTLDGVVTSSGTIIKQISKGLLGGLSSSGTLTETTSKVLSGLLTPDGSLSKLTSKFFGGTISPSGVVTTIKAFTMLVSGTLTTSGVLLLSTSKNLVGTLTSSGSLFKKTSKILSGALTSAGTLLTQKIGQLEVFVGGTLNLAGSLVKQTNKSLSGVLLSSGQVFKQTLKTLSGSLSSSGIVSSIKVTLLSIGGNLLTSGTVVLQSNKVLFGTLVTAGNVIKRTHKILSGILTSIGNLLAVSSATTNVPTDIWTLKPRSFVWTLKPRSFIWTLDSNVQVWSIDPRSEIWTLKSRLFLWTLKKK